MKIYCRHCDKKTPTKLLPNGPHFQASCNICGNWIKFLNAAEKSERLKELLTERTESTKDVKKHTAPKRKNR